MKIIEFDPSCSYRVQQFNDLPFHIYREVKQWVPSLAADTKLLFNLKKNPFFQHSTASFFLAVTDDGSPIGRLVILNNRNFNSYNNTNTAFFCLFECINDRHTSRELFEAGFAWAHNQGMDAIEGPKGFTALDGLGLLVNGFEHRPAFGITYNLPYYPELIEASGFKPESDIVSGFLKSDVELPEKIHRISALVQQRRGLKIINFRTRRELRKMVPKIMETYNSILHNTSGNVPLTDAEVDKIFNQMIWFVNPRLVKIIMKEDSVAGFLFAYPDISASIQKTKGELFPFGWLSMFMELKKTKWVNINGAGIIDQYQGLGGTALLFSEMYKSVLEGGFKYADLVQIGVDNDKMLRELRDLGVDFYKTHRIYKKYL